MAIHKARAFTLIEIMISIMVVTIVLLGILSGYIGCLQINEISRSTTLAMEDARCVIEKMRSLSVSALTDITGQNWTDWAAGNGLSGLQNEQIVVAYTDRDASGSALDDDPLEVTVTVNWMDKTRARSLRLASLITTR